MFAQRPCRGALGAALLFAGLLAAAPTAHAQKLPKRVLNQQVVVKLKEANDLLRMANHDYKGHRIKAIHEVRHAVVALVGKKNAGPHVPPPPGAGKEDQTVSDRQLRDARVLIMQAITTLEGAPVTTARTRALGHLRMAVQELNVALKIA
jgi:hypothetical protein